MTVDLQQNTETIKNTLTEVRKIEKACWTSDMTDKEKLRAFAEYIGYNYSYLQADCVTGAVYTALAARDSGLTSMLLYPGGESNQNCGYHIVTYNLYTNTAVPGGHCACLVYYPDHSVLRYDVQGGSCWTRDYET